MFQNFAVNVKFYINKKVTYKFRPRTHNNKMLRNILRTSRGLARKQINILSPVLLRRYPCINSRTVHQSLSRQIATTPPTPEVSDVEPAVFEEICNETLESLCDYFEEIVDGAPNLKGADVTFSVSSNFATYDLKPLL